MMQLRGSISHKPYIGQAQQAQALHTRLVGHSCNAQRSTICYAASPVFLPSSHSLPHSAGSAEQRASHQATTHVSASSQSQSAEAMGQMLQNGMGMHAWLNENLQMLARIQPLVSRQREEARESAMRAAAAEKQVRDLQMMLEMREAEAREFHSRSMALEKCVAEVEEYAMGLQMQCKAARAAEAAAKEQSEKDRAELERVKLELEALQTRSQSDSKRLQRAEAHSAQDAQAINSFLSQLSGAESSVKKTQKAQRQPQQSRSRR